MTSLAAYGQAASRVRLNFSTGDNGEAGKQKAPARLRAGAFLRASLTMSYFHGKYIPLSSALRRFTVLFGMGRSGTTSLWSSGKEVRPIDAGAKRERSSDLIWKKQTRHRNSAVHVVVRFKPQPNSRT